MTSGNAKGTACVRPQLSTIAGRMLTATFLVCVGILAIAYVNAQGLDVVYVPTPRETVDRMLQVTEVGSSDYVIDLGSGDGRIAIAAGRLGARALGVDLDPARIQDAAAQREAGRRRPTASRSGSRTCSRPISRRPPC